MGPLDRATFQRQTRVPGISAELGSILAGGNMIGGKAPSAYLRQLQGHKSVQLPEAGMDALLASHCLDTASLRADDFEAFVERRRRLLIDVIGEAMGKPAEETQESVTEDEADEFE